MSNGHSTVMGHRLKFSLLLGLISLSALFFYHIDPAGSNALPLCPFNALTGLYCPGCGSLRSLHQLVHGNLYDAFMLNPLAVVALPFLGYAFISYGARLTGWKRRPSTSASAFWIWLLLAAIIAFWIMRNVPLYPFSLLAP